MTPERSTPFVPPERPGTAGTKLPQTHGHGGCPAVPYRERRFLSLPSGEESGTEEPEQRSSRAAAPPFHRKYINVGIVDDEARVENFTAAHQGPGYLSGRQAQRQP